MSLANEMRESELHYKLKLNQQKLHDELAKIFLVSFKGFGWLDVFLRRYYKGFKSPMVGGRGILKGAKAFTWFFQMLLDPSVLPIVNFINKWGLTLLGISLILGLFVRFSSPLGRSAYGFILHSSRLPLSQSEFLHCGPAYYLYRRFAFLRFHKSRKSFRFRQQARSPPFRIKKMARINL